MTQLETFDTSTISQLSLFKPSRVVNDVSDAKSTNKSNNEKPYVNNER